MDKQSFNTAVYDARADDYRATKDNLKRISLVLRSIGKNKKVLDVGCYDGYVSEKIQALGNEVVGIELSKEGIAGCKKRKIQCIEQDVEKKFPFKDQSFDVVFCGEIIEHVYDTDGFLLEIKRVLKRGGWLFLTTPNIASLTRRLRLFLGINPMIDIGLVSPDGKERSAGHIRYFTKESLDHLLKRCGFSMVSCTADFISLHRFRFYLLGKLFPTFGYSLVVKAKVRC